MDVKIEPSWKKALEAEFGEAYFAELTDFVKKEYAEQKVYPAPKDIFKAFDLTPFDAVKAVILGRTRTTARSRPSASPSRWKATWRCRPRSATFS